MKECSTTKKQFTIYLLAAFGLAWILQIIASVFGNRGNQIAFTLIMLVCMYMPLLGVIVAKIPLKGMGWKPMLKGKVRYIFFALWIPVLLTILGTVFFFALFPHTFDKNLESFAASVGPVVLAQIEAQGLNIQMLLIITMIQAVTYAPFINMLPAVGEEAGWRGVMYPYLKKEFGTITGRIVGGVLWGVWHWPVMIFAGYEYGKEYLGAPFLGPVVFCISTVLMGILLDYVFDRTNCIWFPALMHGAINAFVSPMYFLHPDHQNLMVLGPLPLGIIGMIPELIFVIILCVCEKRRLRFR